MSPGPITSSTVAQFVSDDSGGCFRSFNVRVGPRIDDPTVPPTLERVALASGAFCLRINGQPGFTYVIEATTNLLAPPALIPWTPLFTSGTRPNGQFPFADPDSTNFPRRFYRVVRP